MKTLLLLAAVATLATLGGCISVKKETPDAVTVERTTVVHD
jgi:hypothetical protein